MNPTTKRKKDPWRIVLFLFSVLIIVGMWVRKDVAAIYSTLPREQILPVLATTVAVSLLKIAAIAGGVFLVKWLLGKIRKKG